jgi:hypothetical protein
MATKDMFATEMRLSVNVGAEENKGRAIDGWLTFWYRSFTFKF